MDGLSRDYYEKYYEKVHYRGLQGRFTANYHSRLEKNFDGNTLFARVLEIGAGQGEHLHFVKHKYDSYELTDLESFSEENKSILRSKYGENIFFAIQNACNLTYASGSFDRIVLSCVLLHIPNVRLALEELRRVATDSCVIDVYLPCDPGPLYRLLRHVTSHKKQRKLMGIEMFQVKSLWAEEHKNHVNGVDYLIKDVFKDDKIFRSTFPFKWIGPSLNLSIFYRIIVNKGDGKN